METITIPVQQATPSPLTDGSLVLNVDAGGQTLSYISQSATGEATATADVTIYPSDMSEPLTGVVASVAFDSSHSNTTDYSPLDIFNNLGDGSYRVAVPTSGLDLATGDYQWTGTVQASYDDVESDLVNPISGTLDVLNRRGQFLRRRLDPGPWAGLAGDCRFCAAPRDLRGSSPGRLALFTNPSTSDGVTTYTSPAGPFAFGTLTYTPGNTYPYTLADTNGTVEIFNSASELATIIDRDGNSTGYGWSGTELQSITDPSGHTTTFTYADGSVAITDFAGRTTVLTP